MLTPWMLNWINQDQQAGSISPWFLIIVVLVVIILLLWYLGRSEQRTNPKSPAENHLVDGQRAAAQISSPAAPSAPIVSAVSPAAAVSMVESESAGETQKLKEEVQVSPAEAEAFEEAAEDAETAPADYAPIGAPPAVAVESSVQEEPITDGNSTIAAAGAVESESTQPAVLEDLTLIEGIGPKIATVLREAGIDTFIQLAESTPADLSKILLAAGLRLANPSTWPEQARLAGEGKWDEFQALTASLRGGRYVP